MEVFGFSLMSAVAVLIVLAKLDIRKVLGYELWVDLFISILLAAAYLGTYGGMLVGLAAGLIISIALRVIKWFTGYKVLKMIGGKLRWVQYY